MKKTIQMIKNKTKRGSKKMQEKNLQLELGQIMAAKYDDFQLVRKSAYNRVRNVIFRKDKGLDYRELQEKKKKTDEEKQWLQEYVDAKLPAKIKELTNSEKLTPQEQEYIEELFQQLNEAQQMEQRSKKILEKMMKKDMIYNAFITKVKGLNIMSMARLLYYFGYCERARYVSSMWAYAGYTPNSKHTKGESSNFNPKCRVEMFKIGKNLIRSNFILDKEGNKIPGRYRQAYDTEKARQLALMEAEAENAPTRKGHADMRAIRKMVKKLLCDYYVVCKTMTDQELSKPYIIEKGGHQHFDDIIPLLDSTGEI